MSETLFPEIFSPSCTYMEHFFLKQILLPGPENQKFRNSSEHLLQSNVSAIVFPRYESLEIQNENISACVQAAMQKKKFKSADHCCRRLILAVDEIKQLELNELNTISKFLVYFH